MIMRTLCLLAGCILALFPVSSSAELQSLVEPNYPATFTAADWTTTGSNPGTPGGYLYPRLNSNLFIQP